jgi:LysM repeat protein
MDYLRQLKILIFITFSSGYGSAQGETYPGTHTVGPGETLSSIARRHGVSTGAMVNHNGLSNPDNLSVGQVLRLPGTNGGGASPAAKSRSRRTSGSGSSYTVRPGDTLSKIAREHGLRVSDLTAWNGLTDANSLQVGQTLALKGGISPRPKPASSSPLSGVSYKVRPGDTLSAISRRHGVSVTSLQELNGIADPATLAAGQVIAIEARPVAPQAAYGASSAPQEQAQIRQPQPPASPPLASSSLISEHPSRRLGHHTVRPGDTLHSIARENGTTVERLRLANRLGDSNYIRDGQRLRVPSPEETLTRSAVPQLTPTLPPVPDPVIPSAPAPTPQPQSDSGEYLAYTVGPSDQVENVASLFKTSVEKIRILNHLRPDEQLQVGSKIIVPAEGLFGN